MASLLGTRLRVPRDVFGPHIHHTRQPKVGAHGGGRDAVLAGARFGDDPLLAPPPAEEPPPLYLRKGVWRTDATYAPFK